MTEHTARIMIVAGEASGDRHAASLVRALQARLPGATIFGIGGDLMRAAGVDLLYHTDQTAILGFTEVVRHLPFIRRMMRDLLRRVAEEPPHLLILVDYPGFNLRLAKRARRYGVKIFYYIAPQVWAWGAKRARRMARWIDRLAVVFDFEEKLFRSAGLDAHFVGHPLLEDLRVNRSRQEFLDEIGADDGTPLLGLLPGSRVQEVSRLLPEMVQTWKLMEQKLPELRAVVAAAPGVPGKIYSPAGPSERVAVLSGRTYEVMRYCDALVVASGTATLEAACLGTPFVVVYKVSPLSYQIGKRLIRIADIGLVNVVAGRRIVPEFIQHAFRAETLAPVLLGLMTDEDERRRMKHELDRVRSRLGAPGASQRAAELAAQLLLPGAVPAADPATVES